jgi:sugar phosphate isomerase/epimerase
MAHIGLMLYTVRAESTRDFEGTLRAVAGMGYEGVELHELHGHEPRQVRGWLDELGLTAAGRHISLGALESRLPELADEAETLGTPRVIVPWIEPLASSAQAQAMADRLEAAADRAASLGVELGFHNHDGELRPLEDGRTFLERVLERRLFLELDLGWAWWAGIDPAALLEETRGRVPLVHVKDFRTRGEHSYCPVGDGSVGYEQVAPAAVAAGVEWLLVEQDEADGSALEAARRSLAALTPMLEAA